MAGNRILYTYALFFAFILFVLFDLYLFHLLFIFLLILPLVSLLAALPMRKNLRYALEVEDDIMPKGVCGIRLSARNNSLFPCAGVRFTLERHNALGRVGERYTESAEDIVQFPLGPLRTHAMSPSVKMAHCGRVDLNIRRVQVLDTLGLFTLNVSPKNGANPAGSVYVLPELQSRSIQTDEAAEAILKGVALTARSEVRLIKQLRELMQTTKHRLRKELPKLYSQELLNNLFRYPYTKIEFVENDLGVSRITAAKHLDALVAAGYVEKKKIGRTNFYINRPLFTLLTQISLNDE